MGDGSHLLVFSPAACPKCGAATVKQAESLCVPSQDETGEYYCPGSDREDAAGYLLQPTPQSIEAMNAWIDALMKDNPHD